MKLSNLLNTVDYISVSGTLDKDIKKLVYHSDKVTENSLFFAVSGDKTDGKAYVHEAVQKGASAIVFSGHLPDTEGNITLIEVEDVRTAMACMAAEFYENPSEKLLTIGVTGTKGKTTTTFMIHQILNDAGIKSGLIGTVTNGFSGHMEPAHHTTPESPDIQQLLDAMVKGGCKAVVMEVSSQGIKQKRVKKTDFDIGVFTNISPDHIGPGEHKDYEEYLSCKSKLFRLCKRAVINIDQREWPQIIAGSDLEKIVFFGKHEEADFCIGNKLLQNKAGSLSTEYTLYSKEPCGDGEKHLITVNMPGEFNIYNATAAIAVTKSLGIPWSSIEATLKNISVRGRTEIVPYCDEFTVMVDYAHNGMAAENILKNLKEYNPARIITVFGCGGNRDRNRRFEMAEAVSNYADYIIITSDNPRFEEEEQIEADIQSHIGGSAKVIRVSDRRRAIEHALHEGKKDDIIIVMGKGHENYQIIGNNIYHFDDREEILKVKERDRL